MKIFRSGKKNKDELKKKKPVAEKSIDTFFSAVYIARLRRSVTQKKL